MKIPNGKKYILYIKTAKTGGTSFMKYLESIKPVKQFRRINGERKLDNIILNDIIMVPNDTIDIFKSKYADIYKNSYKILIARNPLTRALSGFNSHPLTKNMNDIKPLINDLNYLKYDSTKIDYKMEAPRKLWYLYSLYTHFYLEQTHGLINNDVLEIDYIIYFENLDENIKLFMKEINVEKGVILNHLNQTNSKRLKQFDDVSIKYINERFAKDFKYLNYETGTLSSKFNSHASLI